MNMVIDAGNSLIKAGLFEGDELVKREVLQNAEHLKIFLEAHPIEHLIFSSVSIPVDDIKMSFVHTGRTLVLNYELPLPIKNKYATPNTLGVDRIASACGAWSLFPDKNSLVIDVGTCINYEFISQGGEYLGGAISPGIKIRFRAMHDYTAKLPLAEAVIDRSLIGSTTIHCLQSGVMNGILEEIKGVIQRYRKDYHDMEVILCGGDAHFFENHLKPSIFVAPELVLKGLNSILLHNVTA